MAKVRVTVVFYLQIPDAEQDMSEVSNVRKRFLFFFSKI